jgi:sugar phosphate isomerase/epimerase
MKIGMVTESLASLSFDKMLKASSDLGIEMLEFSTGNWGSAAHLDLDKMLESKPLRANFLAKLAEHDIKISALNCSGNQLAPGQAGKRHDAGVRKTIKLATLLGVDRIVLMSGLPAAPGDSYPNWITVAWPPETAKVLKYQWEKVAIPYWKKLVSYSKNVGIDKLCIEQHGHQLVYNTETLLMLRSAVGKTVGVNFDPSHMMWMGGEPLTAIRPLGEAIFHVHAKDTRIDHENRRPNTLIEHKPNSQVAKRSWNYVTLGYGHPESFWRDFVTLLKQVGYDYVLSIEHEDLSMSPIEGVKKTVDFLQRIIARDE